jgi:hypothetical protein
MVAWMYKQNLSRGVLIPGGVIGSRMKLRLVFPSLKGWRLSCVMPRLDRELCSPCPQIRVDSFIANPVRRVNRVV